MKKLFIVDDDIWLRDLYQSFFEKNGWKVHVCHDPFEAIDQIDTFKPDVLLLDIFLPHTNGIALLHELQSHEDMKYIPVIGWSSHVSNKEHDMLKDYGVSEMLDKTSISPEFVLKKVQSVYEKNR